jgi:hypothetical protein
MGGALSIASGVLVPEVDAVVAFYGTPSSELADPSKAKAPIQAHFGEHDSFVGFSDVTVRLYLKSHLPLLLRHLTNIHISLSVFFPQCMLLFTILDPSWSKELLVSVFATMPFGSSFI